MTVRVILTQHLRQRCRDRRIDLRDVERIAKQVDAGTTWHDSQNQSVVVTGSAADGQTLRVCLVDPPDPDGTIRVKTAFYV